MKNKAMCHIAIFAILLFSTGGLADEKADEGINWQAISSGGHMNTSIDTFLISGTVGQTAIGTSLFAENGLSHGFWQRVLIRGNTEPGPNVEVPITDSLIITFDSVISPGITSVIISNPGELTPPEGFKLVPSSPPIYYEITTTADFYGSIRICFTYDENDIQGNESNLRLMHRNDEDPPGWNDITDTVYIDENRICGITDSFSGFSLAEKEYICGDANGDEDINVGDAVFIINHVFKGGPASDPIETCDANCDSDCNVGDAVYLINHVFKGGPAPCESCK
ncbi:MAG: dockerin type I repeat-containing protein [candidate division Zixibacteria bacterium]